MTTQTAPAVSGAARLRAWWASVPRGWRTVLLAAVAVGLVMAVRPPHAPPLYDGVGFPDEPYRWVTPPAGVTNPSTPVTSAQTQIGVGADGTVPAARAFSAEQGPQIAFAVPDGALTVPKGAKTVTLKATAVSNPIPPSVGTWTSNAYQVEAVTDAKGDVSIAAGTEVVMNLRSDRASKDPVVLKVFKDDAWTSVPTIQVGNDIYAARVKELGTYALFRLPTGTVDANAAKSNPTAFSETPVDVSRPDVSNTGLWIAIAVVVVLLGGGLVIARRRMTG